MTAPSPSTARTLGLAVAGLLVALVAAVPAGAAASATVPLRPSAPAPAPATPRIVGGTALTDPAQAPSTVAVFVSLSAQSGEGCSGTVLDATHVLTAAHCVVGAGGAVAAPAQVRVVAGTTSYFGAQNDPGAATVGAFAVRVHPRYVPGEFDDDVAVLTLSTPLNLATGRIAAATLPAINSSILPRDRFAYATSPVRLSGFGLTSTGAQDYGTLRAVDVSAIPVSFCGSRAGAVDGTDAPAVLLCSQQRGAGACQGDSGGTATVGPEGARVLAGVIDTSGTDCAEGRNLYADVAAPEIRVFIDAALRERDLTADQTPLSPRGGRGVTLAGTTVVGRTISCRRGAWRGGARFRYAFVFVKGRTERNRGLRGRSTYRLRPSDRGWSVSCAVEARNAGGRGTAFWPFSRAVRAR